MRLVFLLACGTLYGQIFPNTGTVVMSCGGRPAWVDATHLVVDSATTALGAVNAPMPRCAVTMQKPVDPTVPLWDIYEATQGSGGWSSAASLVNITTGLRGAGGLLTPNASAGNPDSDGVHLAATAQTPANAIGANRAVTPGPGEGYSILLCNTITTIGNGSGTCCFDSGCGVISTLNAGGASIDPHIDYFAGVYHVFWTERNPTTVPAACFTTNASSTNVITPWVEHWATVSWGGGSMGAPLITGDQPFCPETSYYQNLLLMYKNSLSGSGSGLCDQYYKATSVIHNADGSVTMYTQANQVEAYFTYASGPVTCSALGLGTLGDGVEHAGIMSFNLLTGASYNPLGAGAKMIWPPSAFTATQCLTPSSPAYPHCYAEFPLSQNGEFMAIASNYLVPSTTVELCGNQTFPFGSCSIHQLTEISQFNLLDDKSYQPLTNLQQFGTSFQMTWMSSLTCLGGFPCYYGGFSHYSMLGSNISRPNLAVSFQSSQTFANGLAASEAVVFNGGCPRFS